MIIKEMLFNFHCIFPYYQHDMKNIKNEAMVRLHVFVERLKLYVIPKAFYSFVSEERSQHWSHASISEPTPSKPVS